MEDQENATRRLLHPAAAAAAAAKTFAMAAGNTGRPPSAAPRATLGVLSGNSLHARANNAGAGANGAMMAKTLPHKATNTAKVRTPGGKSMAGQCKQALLCLCYNNGKFGVLYFLGTLVGVAYSSRRGTFPSQKFCCSM